ncbi:transcription factor BHLH42 isoform X2 [Hordeum vulgare subsp. vulgare]|uniref:transcription factor BHLH42 isoform X2 n=1 Tax=Hordeum vulgare subsp. vulgare TaxID=112509 RepID=UPI001D1A5AE0|nr:transcription factor BHLH42 isoform X2 [Hordeum vulgare subsp. vulgare]
MESSGEVQRSLQAAAQGLRWTYALLWQLCPDQGALVWAEGHYNGAIKTRKTVQPAVAQAQAQAPAPAAEAADQARSRQLRELFDSLAREAAAGGGTGFRDVHGCAQEARRPSAALAPEDLTETEWFYLMSASYSFPPGVGLPGRAFARGGHVWLSRANEVDSKAFSRAILAKSAGIKTVLCIPIVDGVLEIGTTEKVEEDIGLVQYAMAIFMDQQETHMIPSICHSNQTSHIDQQSFQTQRKAHTGDLKPEPNKLNPAYEDDEMEYDDDDEIDAECASVSETNAGRDYCRHGPPNIAVNADHATHDAAGSSELMQVEMSERARDGCSSNLGDEIQMLMVCQNGANDEPWHFLYEELCGGYPQSSGENQATAENAHYAQTVSLILHRNNALGQADGRSTGSYLAVSHQSSFSRWDATASIHGRTVTGGINRQKMLKSVLLFFSAACNRPPGDLRCDEGGARREVDFGASHVMQERKRREKLNERFIILRSLVPFVTKMDKASILGDTIEYVKQLTKRVQDLESSAARQQGSSEKRAVLTGMEGASSSSSGSSSSTPVATDVQVSIIESDALLELRCPDRRGLLVTIMQALQEQLRLEVTSVQASSDHGVLLAEMRAKVRELHGRRSSISQVKRAIHLIISSG